MSTADRPRGRGEGHLLPALPLEDDLVAAWLQSPQARWLDFVVSELQGRGYPPLGEVDRFLGGDVSGQRESSSAAVRTPNTLVEIRDPDHPAYSEVSSYIDEVET